MAVFDAIYKVADVVKDIFGWKTGGRTKDQNSLRDEAEHWNEEYNKALAGGDAVHASFAMSQLNKLRDKARSQRTGA